MKPLVDIIGGDTWTGCVECTHDCTVTFSHCLFPLLFCYHHSDLRRILDVTSLPFTFFPNWFTPPNNLIRQKLSADYILPQARPSRIQLLYRLR